MEAARITLYFFIISLFCVNATNNRKDKQVEHPPAKTSGSAHKTESDRVRRETEEFLLKSDQEYLRENALVCKAEKWVKEKIREYVLITMENELSEFSHLKILMNEKCVMHPVLLEVYLRAIHVAMFCIGPETPVGCSMIYCVSQGADDDHIIVYNRTSSEVALTIACVLLLPEELLKDLEHFGNEKRPSKKDDNSGMLRSLKICFGNKPLNEA